ncbi:MAG TPA: hypothetical protein VF172_10485 [Nitrososphaera sp.]|jgi:hypothetical protein
MEDDRGLLKYHDNRMEFNRDWLGQKLVDDGVFAVPEQLCTAWFSVHKIQIYNELE